MTTRNRHSAAHRWAHFLQHLRIFAYVLVLLVAIDLLTGTDNIWVQWPAGIWGAILAMHFVETLFFEGGLFGGEASRVTRDSTEADGEL